jgi:hypothetical protein
VSWTICPDWPQTSILLISASQVARIKSMSHWCLAVNQCLPVRSDLPFPSCDYCSHQRDHPIFHCQHTDTHTDTHTHTHNAIEFQNETEVIWDTGRDTGLSPLHLLI